MQGRYTTDPECVRDYSLLGIDVYVQGTLSNIA
jgi:hypothetical protein